jgi:uncharacterized protein
MSSDIMLTTDGNDLAVGDPAPGHITITDMAWSLAQTNRFLGRCARPYSVAEHSLLVCDIAERELGVDLHGQLAALLHDAHEAYTGDMPTPHKAQLGSAWAVWESRWEHRVRGLFAVASSSRIWHKQIKQADLIALATERAQLMPQSLTRWTVLHGVEPLGRSYVDLMSRERVAMTWADWRDRWLDKYHELDFARLERLGMPTSEVS